MRMSVEEGQEGVVAGQEAHRTAHTQPTLILGCFFEHCMTPESAQNSIQKSRCTDNARVADLKRAEAPPMPIQ